MRTLALMVLLLVSPLFAGTASAAITILGQGSSTRGSSLQNTSPQGCWYMPESSNSGAMSGPGVPVGTELLVVVAMSSGGSNGTSVFSYRASNTSAAQNFTRIQTAPRTSGNEMVSIWYIKNPTPGVINGSQTGAMFTIQGTTGSPTPTSWYRSAAYYAFSGVDLTAPIFSFTNEAAPSNPATVSQTVAQLPTGYAFVVGAVCRAYSGGVIPFPVPALAGLSLTASESGQSGTALDTSISARQDVMFPTDGTTARSATYANSGNIVGVCSAVLRPKYIIAVSADPAAGGSVSGGGSYGAGAAVTITATVNTGYDFVNWTEGGTQVYTNASNGFTAATDRTLVANFIPKTFTVTFDGQGGTAPVPASTIVTYDATYGVVATSTRGTDTFAGWWTGVAGAGTEVTASTIVKITANQTLYAKWVQIPTVNSWPTASAIAYGQALSASTLTGGAASVPGSFIFTAPLTTPSAGAYGASVTFVPTDTANYGTVVGTVSVTVNKVTPSVTTPPTASGITYGQTLSASTLSGGATSVPGSFAFNSPGAVPNAGFNSVAATFIPTDATNYNNVSLSVNVIVGKATPNITTPPTASSITYGQALSASTLSGGVASTTGSFAFTAPGTMLGIGTFSVGVTFTPTNTINYNPATLSVNITVNKVTPTITTPPTSTAITYGEALSASTLNGGAASVPGSFAFTTPAATPNAGTYSAGVTFTPTDTINYGLATLSVNVSVGKATPGVTTPPTATPITYDQMLSASTLSGGEATVPGNFAFTAPGTKPNAGTYSAGVTFTPTDTTNYNTVTTSANVSVGKATPSITVPPTATVIVYGQTLSASTLSGGTVSTPGSFAFAVPATALTVGTTSQPVIFTPADADNYTTATGNASVTVNRKTLTATIINNPTKLVNGDAAATLTSANFSVNGLVGAESVTVTKISGLYASAAVGNWTVTVSLGAGDFTAGSGTSLANYTMPTTATGPGTITDKQIPVVTEWPTASPITYGQALSDSTLTGGAASTSGSFSFTVSATTPNAGTYNASVTFTPTDASSYVTVEENVEMLVNKALAAVTLGSLSHDFDGTAKMATATTSPAGLMVMFTYDGVTTAPTNAGSYAVVGTISDSNYQGSASDTMIIHLSSYTVSGVVTVGVSPLAGVTMNGLPGNPVTDGDGKYAATVDEGFAGTVAPTKEGYTFAPENRDYANVNADQTNQDFVATLTPITVTLAPLITSKNSGDSFTLTATVTGGVGTIHYVWMKDGSNAPYATDNNQYSVASVTKGDAGIYYVYASDDNQTVFSNASTLRVGAGVPALGLAGLGALFGLIIIVRARK